MELTLHSTDNELITQFHTYTAGLAGARLLTASAIAVRSNDLPRDGISRTYVEFDKINTGSTGSYLIGLVKCVTDYSKSEYDEWKKQEKRKMRRGQRPIIYGDGSGDVTIISWEEDCRRIGSIQDVKRLVGEWREGKIGSTSITSVDYDVDD
jgi:hypothetical protein